MERLKAIWRFSSASISRVADVDPEERILLVGPPGSGREAVARAIHAESERAGGPFIPESCALLGTRTELTSKLELARGPEAIKAYLESLAPYVERGGYIPFCDHRCPPDVSPQDYLYYLDLKEEMFGMK